MENVQWEVLQDVVKDHKKIIALGGFASLVLDKLSIEHFKLPHPSPRNRLLNDKSYEQRQLCLCKKYLEF